MFGPDAARFQQLITRQGKEAVKEQHGFAVEQMNICTIKKGKRRWAIRDPWVTYFKRLSEDPTFQSIQIRYVRDLLSRGAYFCRYFGLKSEAAFAFMFDAVSSHGRWWLTKKFQGKEKRRILLEPRLKALVGQHGEGRVPDAILLAIADVLGATSAPRWAQKVRQRKRWFVTGEHPRARELQGLEPRLDAPYATSTRSSGGAASANTSASLRETISEAEGAGTGTDRNGLIGAAIHQARTAGRPEDRHAIKATLEAHQSTVEDWFSGLVPDATFLGLPIRASSGKVPGVHRKFFDALQRAERALLAKHPGLAPAELRKKLGHLQSLVGLRPPKQATSGTLPRPFTASD